MAEARRGREGSRWYNERPSGEQVAEWFRANVSIHDELNVDDYVAGITLINGVEKVKETVGFRDNGTPIVEDVQNVIYTPYPRVDIRIKYFHDLMGAHPEWYGDISPIPVELPRGVHLPNGFFPYRVRAEGGETSFVCCSMKVTVWDRESMTETWSHQLGKVIRQGQKIIDAPPATKMIATARRYADENALMKAETGAIGRALGMAGMLVVPGAGVATAEDLQETQVATPPTPEPPEGAPEPPPPGGNSSDEPSEDELRKQATALIKELKEYPKAYEAFTLWVKERELGKLSEAKGPALRGMVRQLERKVDDAKRGS